MAGKENRQGGKASRDDADGQALWQKLTAGIKPLKGRERREPAQSLPKETAKSRLDPLPGPNEAAKNETGKGPSSGAALGAGPPVKVFGSRPEETPAGTVRSGLNKRDAERLKRGKMPIDARLDLHGMTLPQAHQALRSFVLRAQAAERRCLLVITGTGRTKEGGGALRRELRHWLAEPGLAGSVLGLEQAQPQHGGAGAFYLLLRRKRTP